MEGSREGTGRGAGLGLGAVTGWNIAEGSWGEGLMEEGVGRLWPSKMVAGGGVMEVLGGGDNGTLDGRGVGERNGEGVVVVLVSGKEGRKKDVGIEGEGGGEFGRLVAGGKVFLGCDGGKLL